MAITSAANTGKLSGLTLFITGATRGVGKALALKVAKDGANVVIAARTTVAQSKLRNDTIYTVAGEVEKAGGRAYPVPMDLRSELEIRATIEHIAAKLRGGVIDIVVNSASVVSLSQTTATSVDRFDLMHQVNTRGTYLVSQLCLPHLKRSKQPQILNMCPPLNLNPLCFANHLPIWLPAPTGCPQKDFTKCRKPEFVADAAYMALTHEPTLTGKFYLCEDLFKEAGIKDLSAYDMKPGNLLAKELFIDEQQSSLLVTRDASQGKAAIAPIETVAEAFDRFGSILSEFAARNKLLNAGFMFRLSSGSDTHNWYLDCSRGRALAIFGPSYLSPDVEFRMDSLDFLRLCNGELQFDEAFASGKLNAFGSSELTQRFKDILQFLRESNERKAEKSFGASSPIKSDYSAAAHVVGSDAVSATSKMQQKADRNDSFAKEAIELFQREAKSLTSSIATLTASLSSQSASSSASVASHVETIKRHLEDQLATLKSDLVAATTASSKESHRQLQAVTEKLKPLDSLKQLEAQLARLTSIVQTESGKHPGKPLQFTRDELKRMCNDVADALDLVNAITYNYEGAGASKAVYANRPQVRKVIKSLGDLHTHLVSRNAAMEADQPNTQSDRLKALERQLSGQITALSGKLDSVAQNNPRVSVVESASNKEATEKISADLRKLSNDVGIIVTNLKQLSADVGVRTMSDIDYDSAEGENGSESDSSSYSTGGEEESLSEQISDLSSEIAELRSEVKAIAASIGSQTQDDSSSEGSASSSEDEQRASIMAKLNELSKAIEEMDFDALSEKVDELQEDIGVTDLTEKVDTLTEKVEEAVDDISEKLDSLTETVEKGWNNESLEAKVDDVSTEIERVADKLNDLDIEDISDKIDQLSDKVDELLPEDLKNAVRDLSEKIDPLKDVAETINQLSARMDRTESSKLEAKLNALGRQIAALEESVDHSTGRVVNVSAELAALSAAIGRNSSLGGGAKPPGDRSAVAAEIGGDPAKMAPAIGLMEKRLEAVIQKQSSDSRKQSDSTTKKLIALVLIGAAAGGFYLNRTASQMKRNSDSAATEAAKAALTEFVATNSGAVGCKKTDAGFGLESNQQKEEEELNGGVFSALLGTGLLGVVVLIAALL